MSLLNDMMSWIESGAAGPFYHDTPIPPDIIREVQRYGYYIDEFRESKGRVFLYMARPKINAGLH